MLYRLLARSSWQFYKRHPAQLLLSILGIVLGVGIVSAVLITNDSSQRAFALSTEALYGRTTHQLEGANGIQQQDYVQLRRAFPDIPMAPVVEGHVAIDNEVFSVLGLDPFVEAEFGRNGSVQGAPFSDLDISALLQSSAVAVSQISAERSNLPIGDIVDVDIGGRLHPTLLAATFSSSNPAAATGLLIGDIGFVQALLERGNRIDRIDLILNQEQLAKVREQLPSKLRITAAAARQQTMQAMTRGFQINLSAMSMLALVVGAFLIHNTMTFAVLQRRELFAIKRITGVTARTILVSILCEAFAISAVASVIGIALGYGLAHALIRLTTQTINDLYFVLHVQQIWFSPWLIAGGLLLGIGSSMVAASLSAIDAASTSPIQARQRSLVEERTHKVLPGFAISGAFTMLAGMTSAALPSQSLLIGFAALMMLILGYGLVIPWAVLLISRALRPISYKVGIATALALGGIERNISRTGLAIAALTIAVSATFGVDIMIGSFRATVDHWLGRTLQSDIYLSAPSTVSAQSATLLAAGIADAARKVPGVRSVSTGRVMEVASDAGNIDMLVVEPHEKSTAGFELLSGGAIAAWNQWQNDDTLMISEPLATKQQLTVGDELTVFTEINGQQSFRVAGVFRDYGSSHGMLMMSRKTYEKYWRDNRVGSLGILVRDTALAEVVIQELRTRLATADQPLLIRSNTAIHSASLKVFDRTFEVTRVLRWLTVGVAFVGIFSALLALHLERAREFAILRSTGATRRQIIIVVIAQTLMMGLLAGLLALPLGWIMSELLIKVINVRSFGWSMQSLLPEGSIVSTIVLACLSAVLAGIYPAWRLSRADIAAQLRDE